MDTVDVSGTTSQEEIINEDALNENSSGASNEGSNDALVAPPPPEPLSVAAQQQLQIADQVDQQIQANAVGIPMGEAMALAPAPAPAAEPAVPAPEPVAQADVQGVEEHPPAYEQPMDAQEARKLATDIIHKYFTTQFTPLTRHHIESYDQFIERDLREIIASQNPIIILKNPKDRRGVRDDYKYEVKIYMGGESGNEIFVGTPTVSLQNGEDVRTLFPNEARLRNMTYALQVQVNVKVEITIRLPPTAEEPRPKPFVQTIDIPKLSLCNIPLMLHSRYCVLHGKPAPLLTEMGECPQDPGGYFIIDGSEKVIVTRQEGAFNTLWVTEQKSDPNVHYYASISSLNPKSRDVKRVSFFWTRDQIRKPKGFSKKEAIYKPSVLEVSIPLVLKPIPIFVLFRALGIQTDEDIFRQIFPDFSSPEAKTLADMLTPSVNYAAPFMDTYSAVQYIKSLTKGFSEFHVLDILHNHLFPHIEDKPGARVAFLADCVRKILRVIKHMEAPASRDDTRNQRLLTSGFLCQMLFHNIYKTFIKMVKLRIDETFSYNESLYSDMNFLNIFAEGNRRQIFAIGHITEGIMRGFKGKWIVGNNQEQAGVLQELSRLSYLDFISHLRHAVLNFDTGMKLQGPRRLNPSQYGYFCTSETPSGGSIGITKNLTMMTAISTATNPEKVMEWLFSRGTVIACEHMTPELATKMVPVYINSGIIGYTGFPKLLSRVLRFMKRTGFLPPLSSTAFSIPERRIFIYLDDGRPLRPLIICEEGGSFGHVPPRERFQRGTWRDLIVGTLRPGVSIGSHDFTDPLADTAKANLEDYIKFFEAHADKAGLIEYIDPYEQNEILIANYPEHVLKETTHMEVHPSTILGLLGNMIPFPNHNQSPRNQLSASQSKQGLSIYATNWKNRFDNTANVLCYGEAPLSRTIYQDYIGGGKMPYGQNIILAMGMYGGYNQEDGIIMNADALARGQFRSINYRSYELFEEDDPISRTKTRIGNPKQIPGWNDLKPNLDYSKLDDAGLVRVGEYVDQNTVIVGGYMISPGGQMKDASKTPQVWTRGRVESVVVTMNNNGLRLVKVRVTQDRVPELGDKFCLTDDHDVLTKNRGWVSIAEVTVDDEVAQLNKGKNMIEYVHPNETFVFEHTGQMYEVKTQGVNLCTTLNHRMWVQKRNSNSYELIEAKDMMGRRVKFSSFSPSPQHNITTKIGDKMLTEDEMSSFITLFGIWMAEGWVYISEKDYIARLEISADKPDVKEILKNVCDELKLNYNFREPTKKFYINSKEYAQYFKQFSVGAINKFLPSWCFELSQEQSKQLLEAMCVGDGHETLTSLHYGTSSIKLRDGVQILAQHAGYTSTYVKIMDAGQINVGKDGIQFKANADHWGVYIRRKRLYPTLNHGHSKTQGGQSEKIINYSGKVYCISVPSEVFLVRRQGTIVWTGNSNRHGQKGTINVMYRATDMPRTAEGITPDMIMNPTAIPSRMTIGQILEMIFGNVSAEIGAIGNVTAFMNDGSPHEMLGNILEKLGLNRMCNQVLYNGMTGEQMEADIFMGVVYGMRLKHMTEDKWNARGQGRREQRTHQPTGGRGNEGGMKLGEMERDAIVAHGVSAFQNESYMMRSDGTTFYVCNGCGTIPLYNERQDLYICPLCDGPIEYSGDNASNLEPIPPSVRSATSFSKIKFPYATKLFFQELETFANMGMRILTTRDTTRLNGLDHVSELVEAKGQAAQPLRPRVFHEPDVPVLQNVKPAPTAADIARELDILQSRAVETFQQELQQVAADRVANQAPSNAQQEANRVIQSLVAANQQGANQGDVQLAPASIAPPPAPQAQAQPLQLIQGAQPPLEIVAGDGAPVINVDTGPEAMAAAGLRQPGDATASIQPPAPVYQQQQGGQPIRRRARMQYPRQQYGGYNYGPAPPQQLYGPVQQQPPMPHQQQEGGQEDSEPQAPAQYAQRILVQKEG